MPTVLAASTISVPAGTVILWPSMVRLMSGMRHSLADVALVPEGVVLVLLPEMAEGGVDDQPGRVAQAAEAPPVLQAVGHPEQVVDLDLRALVGQDPLVHAHRPISADPARCAFAARDRKSTRLNSSHVKISYAVFC